MSLVMLGNVLLWSLHYVLAFKLFPREYVSENKSIALTGWVNISFKVVSGLQWKPLNATPENLFNWSLFSVNFAPHLSIHCYFVLLYCSQRIEVKHYCYLLFRYCNSHLITFWKSDIHSNNVPVRLSFSGNICSFSVFLYLSNLFSTLSWGPLNPFYCHL